jgi:hypothetical protein
VTCLYQVLSRHLLLHYPLLLVKVSLTTISLEVTPMAARRLGFFTSTGRFAPNGPAASSYPQPPARYDCPSPSPNDVLETKALLLKKLPIEIVDVIIERAGYWPCISVRTGGRTTIVGSYGNNSDVLIVSISILSFIPTLVSTTAYKLIFAL